MIPPINGTNHVQMLLHLLSLLQPLAGGGDRKVSKASEFFIQTMQDAPFPTSGKSFEHSAQLLPSLHVYQQTFERVAPLTRKNKETPEQPHLMTDSFSASLPKEGSPIEKHNNSQSENAKLPDEPIHLDAELPPTPLYPHDPDQLPPSTFRLAQRLVELIQTALGDLESDKMPAINPDEIPEKIEPLRQIALRLQPVIVQLIDNLESFPKPPLNRSAEQIAFPSSASHELAARTDGTVSQIGTNIPKPRPTQIGGRDTSQIMTPQTQPHTSHINRSGLSHTIPNTYQAHIKTNFSPSTVATGPALRIRVKLDAPESTTEGTLLSAAPYFSTTLRQSSIVSAKRKKEKKKQSEDRDHEDPGQMDDYSEKI